MLLNLLGILLKWIILVRVLQRKRINRSVHTPREMYSKESAHEMVEAWQAQNVPGSWQAGDPREDVMLFESECHLPAEFLLAQGGQTLFY